MDEGPKQFVIQAARSALMAVEVCLVAAEKASSGDAKILAETSLEMHCEIANFVVDTALGQGVTLPADFDDNHRQMIYSLLSLSGEEFDRAFVEALIREDETVFFFLSAEAAQSSDSNVEKVVALVLSRLEEQLLALRSHMSRPHLS